MQSSGSTLRACPAVYPRASNICLVGERTPACLTFAPPLPEQSLATAGSS